MNALKLKPSHKAILPPVLLDLEGGGKRDIMWKRLEAHDEKLTEKPLRATHRGMDSCI